MKDFQRRLYELVTTPEERACHEAKREEKRKELVRKRLYTALAKKGVTAEEVDEGRLRLEKVMKLGHQ
jgi:hypothetical protein